MKSKKRKYIVKSKMGKFEAFTIEDDGLGYLPRIIEDYIFDKYKILSYDEKRGYKDILVKPFEETKRWYKIENMPGSSEEILVEDYKPKIIRW